MQNSQVITAKSKAIYHEVLRKTYVLLALTLICSGITSILAMTFNVRYPGFIIVIVGMFGLLFLTRALSKSKWGILAAFLFTGFMGYILGPTLNFYLHNFSNGGTLILTALGGTGIIFFGLSAYTLITRKDFSYLGGFLFIAITIAFLASLAALFLICRCYNLLSHANLLRINHVLHKCNYPRR